MFRRIRHQNGMQWIIYNPKNEQVLGRETVLLGDGIYIKGQQVSTRMHKS